MVEAESIIAEIINEHNWQIRSIADKIMRSDYDLDTIEQIISNHNKFDPKSNFDQFLNQKDLSWVDKHNNLVIKNKVGTLQYPQEVSKLYEVFNSKEDPWKLIISKDLPLFHKGYNLILTSFGVTDTKGNYLGSIVSSIDINLIQNALNNKLTKSNQYLVVLNSYNNKIVFQSNIGNSLKDLDFFKYKIRNINYEESAEGKLEHYILVNNVKYTNYKKDNYYPFVIVSGYDYSVYKSQLLKLLFSAIYPNIAIGLILLVTLLIFYRLVVYPIKILSEIIEKTGFRNFDYDKLKLLKVINSKETYNFSKSLLKVKHQGLKLQKSNSELTKTKNQLEEAIEIIKKSDITQIEIIKQIQKDISKNTAQVFTVLKMLRHNIGTNSSYDTKMNLYLVQSLEQGIENITKFATDELNKEYVDIRSVINKSVLSQEKEMKIRNIKFDVIYGKNLPKKVFIDQVRLTQVLSAILHKTISLLSERDSFSITVKTVTKNKTKQLSISIKDDGIGIGFKDHARDAKRFGNKEEGSVTGIDISIDTIEDLVKLHQGDIFYENQIQQGSKTTIIIPCFRKVIKVKEATVDYNGSNIIKLPIKNKSE